MSQNLVMAIGFLVSSVFILFLFYLFFRWVEKRETLKRDEAVVNLGLAMFAASREDLRFAEARLKRVGFDFFCEGMIKLPKYFWDCKNLELMARTLRTCGKILTAHVPDKEETFVNFSDWLGNILFDKTRYTTDTAKAMAILASICSSDPKLAINLVKFMFMASLDDVPPMPWVTEAK